MGLRERLYGVADAAVADWSVEARSHRSPLLAILASLGIGLGLAIAFVLGPAAGTSEPVVTGSVMLAFGIGWGVMAILTSRFSAQPQPWMAVPAVALGFVGLGLILFRPGPAAMDVLSWIWPVALLILGIWMLVQVRRHLTGGGRWLVIPTIAVLMLIAVGGAFETVSGASGRANATGPGQLIDVGGHQLYIECSGSGSPAVVLQSGLGESSSSWSRIAPDITASTKVCAYDRPGHGRSDEAEPQDGIALASDLHTLLDRAGVAGPYVLVGHSSGGDYVRVFAGQYSEVVAGLVLIDAQPADAFSALPDYPTTYRWVLQPLSSLTAPLARIGLYRLFDGHENVDPAYGRAYRDAVTQLPEVLDEARAVTSLGSLPLIVVSAGTGQQAGWDAAQERLAELSTRSAHRVIPTATHDSLISGDDASASSQAILDVLAAIRSGTDPQ
jgi:pimeloyl-ACP methyl ester carboxylesterase